MNGPPEIVDETFIEIERPTVSVWLAQARAGSTEALGRLLELYRPRLHQAVERSLNRNLQGKVSPSDVTQDALLTACSGFGNFQGSTVPEFIGWLDGVLNNKVSETVRFYVRAKKRAVSREVSLDAIEVRRQVEQAIAVCKEESGSDEVKRAHATIARLKPLYREILSYRHEEGLSFQAIGERMGRNPAATRMLFWRACRHLKKEMGAAAKA